MDENQKLLDANSRATLAPLLVGAWLRSGDLEKARAAVQGTELVDDDETQGWLALYDGDLLTARKRLVRAETRRPELVDALGLLARARIDHSLGLGQAFLLLAKRDTVAAALRFAALADSTGDAAPALLSLAARLENNHRNNAHAVALWERIIKSFPKSPEAPEALLTWARQLAVSGDLVTAVTRYETLLVDYPDSALLPQGRRELEKVKEKQKGGGK